MAYVLHLCIMVLIFSILAMSLDLSFGQAGLLSASHAAFYGVGAYTAALVTVHCSFSFGTSALLSLCAGGLASLFASIPSLRLRDEYFVLSTFAFQMIAWGILNNWVDLTRGSMGIMGIDRPSLLGVRIDSSLEFLILVGVSAGVVYSIVLAISRSQAGRILRAIREDELFAQSLGKNTSLLKMTAFAISAMFAAYAGALYAHYMTYIDPTVFTISESILIISMVILGGAGSVWGPVIGSLLLIAIPELLRSVGLPGSVAANLRQILYGAVLIIILRWRPSGLVGTYSFMERKP